MLYFIVNPNSGRKNSLKLWKKIQNHPKLLSSNYTFEFTKKSGHACNIVQDGIKRGFRKFVCIGGDGTLNEIINGIMTQSCVASNEIFLGIIPTGTGNDWCKTHNISNDLHDSLDIILNEKSILQDVGKIKFINSLVEEKYFINVAGIGFDAVVANNVNFDKSRGKFGKILFFKNLFKSLNKYESKLCTIQIDKDVMKFDVFSISIGIGKFNGGGMKQMPLADPRDGLFDITLIPKISKFDVFRYSPMLYSGKFLKHPKIHTFKCKTINIFSSNNLFVEVDGEFGGTIPAEISILPQAVNVYSKYKESD